jgi:hypothetical protein
MSKLRLVKERSRTVESENDLRGLGNDPVLTQGEPRAILTILGVTEDLRNIEEFLSKNCSDLKAESFDRGIHVTKYVASPESFKLDVVDLFAFYLELVIGPMKHKDITGQLWSDNAMKFHLTKTGPAPYAIEFDTSTVAWDCILKVEFPVTFHLNQAGYDVPRSRQPIALSSNELNKIFEKSMSVDSTNNDVFKRAL